MKLPGWLYTPTGKRSCARLEPAPSRKGAAALMMIFLLVIVLSSLAADLQNTASVSLKLGANARDRLQAHFHAMSAVDLEFFFLRYEAQLKKTPIGNFLPIPLSQLSTFFVSSDTMQQMLVQQKHPRESLEELDEEELQKLPFGQFEGSFWIEEVANQSERLNVNAMALKGLACKNPVHLLLSSLIADEKYDPLFERIGENQDPAEARLELIANIQDYIDRNEFIDPLCALTGQRTGSNSDERDRYDNLPYGATYDPKNGKLLSVKELRMIPGVNDAVMAMFSDYLTVWSDGLAISLKDASDKMLTLVALSLIPQPYMPDDQIKIAAFIKALTLKRAEPLWKLTAGSFEEVMQTASLRYDSTRYKQWIKDKQLRFDSKNPVYRIKAVGRVGDTTSTMTVVWRDNSGAGQVLYWREE